MATPGGAWRALVAERRRAGQAGDPSRAWEWNKTPTRWEQAHIEGDEVVWSTCFTNPHAGGGASNQSLETFLTAGPRMSGVPDDVLAGLIDAVLALRG